MLQTECCKCCAHDGRLVDFFSMFARSIHRRYTAWLAMLAMVFGALVPTVAQAVVASRDGATWVQVCSASGAVWVQLNAADDKSTDPSHDPVVDASRHCPWCNLHGSVDLPPSPLSQPRLDQQSERPFTPVAWPPSATFWPTEPPRGPPLV